MAKRRRRFGKPTLLGDIFSKQPGARKGAVLVDLYRVQQAWKEAVGEALAKRTFPKRVQAKRLIIAAESPVWSHHLSMMKEQILEAIAKRTGKVYEDLKFTTEPIPDLESYATKRKVLKPRERRGEIKEDLKTLLKRVGQLRQEFEASRKKSD